MTWLEAALIALSEGICPEHGRALEADGWCRRCGLWWAIGHDPGSLVGGEHQVITRYATPNLENI